MVYRYSAHEFKDESWRNLWWMVRNRLQNSKNVKACMHYQVPVWLGCMLNNSIMLVVMSMMRLLSIQPWYEDNWQRLQDVSIHRPSSVALYISCSILIANKGLQSKWSCKFVSRLHVMATCMLNNHQTHVCSSKNYNLCQHQWTWVTCKANNLESIYKWHRMHGTWQFTDNRTIII